MNILNIEFKNRMRENTKLSNYQGKFYLVINTSSKCGLTPQFAGQELADGDVANEFCKLNYGVTFDIMEKVEVN